MEMDATDTDGRMGYNRQHLLKFVQKVLCIAHRCTL